MEFLAVSVLIVGVLVLLASAAFDFADMGGWAGTSTLGIGLALTALGGIPTMFGPSVLAWLGGATLGAALHQGAAAAERALRQRTSGEIEDSSSLVGTTVTVASSTDEQGQHGTAYIVVGGVKNRILIDSEHPLHRGDRVWIVSIDDTASSATVRPI